MILLSQIMINKAITQDLRCNMVTHEIELKNKELLNMMEELRKEFYQLKEDHGVEDGISERLEVPDVTNEYYCEEEYLEFINPTTHVGFPTSYYSINMPQLKRKQPDIWSDYVERVKNKTAALLGAHTSALALMYPPEGFVAWHTNWNSPSYQILFTWSETGEGYFRYKDPSTGEIITLHDKPGWNVRYHYFGSVEEKEHVLWHCAYTKCDRFSFAYKYENGGINSAKDAMVKEMLEDTLYEISN